jgi:C-terminal processing protease CtpA/Prc
MLFKKFRLIPVIILCLGIFASCKKKDSSGTTASTADLIKDTTIDYARDIYLWYNQIPANFDARSYADPNAIMEAIRQYSIEPPNSRPVDRFSFAMKQTEWNSLSSGVSVDFGFSIFFLTSNDLRVKYVERESAAGKAGVKRGWRIMKYNGNSNIATDQATIDAIVKAVFESTTTSFTFLKPDGSTVDITLNAATYQTHPVMKDSVYTISGKKIGYLVFNSFLGDQTEISNEFSRVFTRFATYGINDIVVDLRYNGGGYVSLAEKLSNYLAPSTASGMMMTQKYNDKYASKYNVVTNFNKAGTVNLPRVIFIVSSSTASASELVINNLKAVSDVKLIGRNSTYGKPVGFFPIPVGDWYIFPVSFKTVNKAGSSDYYSGFVPDATIADGLDKDWGDITETSLASAIKYITTGAFRLQSDATFREIPAVVEGNNILEIPAFKGTIGNTKLLK